MYIRVVMLIVLLALAACASPKEQPAVDEPALEILPSAAPVSNTETTTVEIFPTQTPEPTRTEPVMTPTVQIQESAFSISSPAFQDGGEIPVQFTCEGEDISPQLNWVGVPDGSESLALIVDDPDAPSGTWVHWVLYNIPPDLDGLEQGAQGAGVGAVSSFGRTGYGGPCPPSGSPHRYFFKLYALDVILELDSQAEKTDVENAMQGHILAEAVMIGTFAR